MSTPPDSPAERPSVDAERVDVGGYRMWMRVSPGRSPTVVFESGGGDNSSVWSAVEPEVRRRTGASTVVYDRAGLGQSEPNPGPYQIDDEVAALRTALTARGVRGPIVLVAHSYGGFVSLLMAGADPRVAGLVLVDGNLPGFFDDAEVDRILARFRAQLPEIEREAPPKLAEVMIPLTLALGETARRVRSQRPPSQIPVIDIIAERTWVESPEEVAALRREHAAFVAASPNREAMFAAGSGHYVMRDRPDIVLDAISRIVERLRAA